MDLRQAKPCRRKAFARQRKRFPKLLLNSECQRTVPVENSTFPAQVPRCSSRCKADGPFIGAEDPDHGTFQGEPLLSKSCGSKVDGKVHQGKQCSSETSKPPFPIEGGGPTPNGGESNNGESREIKVLNNASRKYCCRRLKQNGVCGLLTTKSAIKVKQCPLKSRSLFMMYKKLSMVKFRIRFYNSKFWRRRICPSSKDKVSWVERVTREREEDIHRGVSKGCSGTWLRCWKSKSHSPWNLHSLSDMNNHMPGPLLEESLTRLPDSSITQGALLPCRERCSKEIAPRDQNGVAENCVPLLHGRAPCRAEVAHKQETGEASTVSSCPENIFIPVMEKEISVMGQEDGNSNQVTDVDEVVLERSKVDLGAKNVLANGPAPTGPAPSEDSCSQMEVEGAATMDIFGAELLDHLYCKSPLSEPPRGNAGQKSGTQKSGKRSSQRASSVSDEQLATWLCGIYTHLSLIPGFVCTLYEFRNALFSTTLF